MRAILASLSGLVLALASPVAATDTLETRTADEDTDSPRAKADALDWLVGSWSGPGMGGAIASETWTMPVGGTMVGTFVQRDGEGSVLFTELMYIRPVGESLEMAIKHFNPDLTSWEEKDEVERFRLIALEDCAAYFQGLTIRCADRERPGEGLVVAVRAGSDEEGRVKELVFRYRPASINLPVSYGCTGTTFAVNQCLARIKAKAEAREKRYFAAALGAWNEGVDETSKLQELMRASQVAAQTHREEECNAVFELWREGSIRNAMSLACSIRLIDQRTHHIWLNWLTLQDSSAPILPEPGPSR